MLCMYIHAYILSFHFKVCFSQLKRYLHSLSGFNHSQNQMHVICLHYLAYEYVYSSGPNVNKCQQCKHDKITQPQWSTALISPHMPKSLQQQGNHCHESALVSKLKGSCTGGIIGPTYSPLW